MLETAIISFRYNFITHQGLKSVEIVLWENYGIHVEVYDRKKVWRFILHLLYHKIYESLFILSQNIRKLINVSHITQQLQYLCFYVIFTSHLLISVQLLPTTINISFLHGIPPRPDATWKIISEWNYVAQRTNNSGDIQDSGWYMINGASIMQ